MLNYLNNKICWSVQLFEELGKWNRPFMTKPIGINVHCRGFFVVSILLTCFIISWIAWAMVGSRGLALRVALCGTRIQFVTPLDHEAFSGCVQWDVCLCVMGWNNSFCVILSRAYDLMKKFLYCLDFLKHSENGIKFWMRLSFARMQMGQLGMCVLNYGFRDFSSLEIIIWRRELKEPNLDISYYIWAKVLFTCDYWGFFE